MWTIGEMKERGKAAFKANYWKCVLAALLLSLTMGSFGNVGRTTGNGAAEQQQADQVMNDFQALDSSTQLAVAGIITGAVLLALVIAVLLRIFLFNPLQVGCYRFFKNNTIAPPAALNTLKDGFGNYGHTFVTLLLRDIFLVLWTLLFIIPGFVKAYSYRMVPFILADEPQLSSSEVITRSKEMMNGHKWNTFLMDLSFIGWIILGCITCGLVLVFWEEPYRQSANAALYLRLSGREKEGIA